MSGKEKREPMAAAFPMRRGHGGASRFQKAADKPKDVKRTLKRLWSYFGNERKLLAFVFLTIFIDSFIVLLAPYLIGRAVDAMSLGEHVAFQALHIAVFALLVAYVTSALLHFFQGWLTSAATQRIVKRLRNHLFSKLQKLPLAYFDRHTHGELMSRLTNDIDNVSISISQSVTHFMGGIIVLFGSLVMMIILSPVLTAASLLTIPLIFLLTKTIAKKTRHYFREQQKELGLLNGQIEETISGLEVVKAFNHEEKAIAQFYEVNERLKQVGTKAQIWSGFLMPMMNVINNFGFMIVAVVGGILAVKGMVTIGVIASFITYSRQFGRPLNDLANVFNLIQSGIAGAERVFDVLDEIEEPADVPNARPIVQPKGEVEFKNVSFRYRGDVEVLKNISFHAKPGTVTAFVGPTGAGKTTIVNLLTRFYDVTDGAIYLDGLDIREYRRDDLRKCFGFVLQDTYLFSGTIMENIRYARPEAADEEVIEAAKLANAHPFIMQLPNGYETELTENGGNLSHGQKQLLAIARAILAKPHLFILDEATSSIDTRTELAIQEALKRVLKGKTSFIIAHRLNTIKDADNIIVIDQGKIVEQGSHEELMRQKGVYYEMIKSQYESLEEVVNQ